MWLFNLLLAHSAGIWSPKNLWFFLQPVKWRHSIWRFEWGALVVKHAVTMTVQIKTLKCWKIQRTYVHTASCWYKLLHLQSPNPNAGPRVHACWRTHPLMMQHLSWDFVSGGASWPCGFSTCSWHIRLAFGPPRILGFFFNLSSGGILSEGLGGGLLRKKTRCDDGCPKKNAERSKEHMDVGQNGRPRGPQMLV